jgi:uncharacterized membrane protein
MEKAVNDTIQTVGLGLEVVVVVIVLIGGIRALLQLFQAMFARRLDAAMSRLIWIDFATAILLALEFALGADIVRTAVAPTWDDIGQLAAIAAIRTGLGFFLGRDVDEFSREQAKGDASK